MNTLQQVTANVTNSPPDKTAVHCEVYSRIVGYLRPVENWNDSKRQEFKDRVTFNVTAGASPEAREPGAPL